MRCTAYHAGVEPFHGAARGCHAQEGQESMNKRGQSGREPRAGKAQSDAHIFEIGLTHRVRMLGEQAFQPHGTLLLVHRIVDRR